METHFRIRQRNTFLCPFCGQRKIVCVHNSQSTRPHRVHVPTRKRVSVSDTETHFRVHSVDRVRFFVCITHRVHVPTQKHISVSDTEMCFRVLAFDCTEFLSAQVTDGSCLAVAALTYDVYCIFV